MITRIKYLLKYIAIAVAVVGIPVAIISYDNYTYSSLLKNGRITICRITPLIGNIKFYYQVDGVNYTKIISSPFSGFNEGEQFLMVYDPEKKDNAAILYWKPIIPNDGTFKEIYASKIEQTWENNNEVRFEYSVNGIMYKRYQKTAPEGARLSKARKYTVKYNVNNPRIAYVIDFIDRVDR